MIRIAISGASGRMGRALYSLVKDEKNFSVVFGVDPFPADDLSYPVYNCFDDCPLSADVIVDFSSPCALDGLLDYAMRTKTRVVLATTGYTDEQFRRIKYASERISIFYSANMSLGVSLLTRLSRDCARFLKDDFDIEIIETHHSKKADSPSGTAIALAESINSVKNNSLDFVCGRDNVAKRRDKNEIGLHSVRGGSVVGKHDVLFLGNGEIIRLSHEAESKDIFVRGALRATKFLLSKEGGIYVMSDLISDSLTFTSAWGETDLSLLSFAPMTELEYIALLRSIKDHKIFTDALVHCKSADGKFSLTLSIKNQYLKDLENIFQQKVDYTIKGVAKIKLISLESNNGEPMFTIMSIMKSIGARVYHTVSSENTVSVYIDEDKLSDGISAIKNRFKI